MSPSPPWNIRGPDGVYRGAFDHLYPESDCDQSFLHFLSTTLNEKFPDSSLHEVDDDLSIRASLSYKQVYDISKKLSETLLKRGVKPKTVVHLLGENSLMYIIASFACFWGRIVVSSSHYLSPWAEVARNSNLCTAQHLIVTENSWENIKDDFQNAKPTNLKSIVILAPWFEANCFEVSVSQEIHLQQDKVPVLPPGELDDVYSIFMSSGTTGVPKPIKNSNKNIVGALLPGTKPGFFNTGPQSNFFLIQPLAHAGGYYFSFMSNLANGCNFYIDTCFKPESFMQALEKFHITDMFTVNQVFLHLVKNVENANVSSLKQLFVGGMIVTPKEISMMEKVKKLSKAPNLKIKVAFGMTDITSLGYTHHDACEGKIDPRSVGVLLPHLRMKMVHIDTGKVCEPNEPGEMHLKGPNVTIGYMNDPVKNAESFDEDGFLKTGDLGVVNENGEVFILSRLKDVIKFRGFSLSPAEIEQGVMTHEAVAECMVVGQTSEEHGEIPVALVVLKELSKSDQKELMEEILSAVKKQVSGHKALHKVMFVENLPRSGPLQKLDRKVAKVLVNSWT